MRKALLTLFSLFLLFSCSVHLEERRYTRGYYVKWLNRNKHGEVKGQSASRVKHKSGIFIESTRELPDIGEAEHVMAVKDQKAKAIMTRSDVIANKAQQEKKEPFRPDKQKTSELPRITVGQSFQNDNQKNGDALIYFSSGLVLSLLYLLMRKDRKRIFKITRWANANKWHSRFLISSTLVGLGISGIQIGLEASKLGWHFSNNLGFVFAGLMSLGFLATQRDQSQFVLLKDFDRKKVGYLLIGIAFSASSADIGNRIGEHKQQYNPLGSAINYVAFADNTSIIANDHDSSFANGRNDNVTGMIILYFILSVILIFVLASISCFAFCAGGAAAGIPVTIACILLTVYSIRGMVRAINERKSGVSSKRRY